MKLWLMWVLTITVAFGVGGRLGVALSPSRDPIVIGYLGLTASLILAGVLQWLMLRGLIPDAGRWVPVSVAAVAILGVLAFGLGLINRDVGWGLGRGRRLDRARCAPVAGVAQGGRRGWMVGAGQTRWG